MTIALRKTNRKNDVMDGTTAGNLGFTAPQPPVSNGGGLFINHVDAPEATAQAQVLPQPTPVVPSAQQTQYSQVTPVYAPGPTNSVTDIPQPAVKGIEFVKAPTAVQPPIISEPVMQPAPAPQPVMPPAPPVSATNQLIQPVLPPPLTPSVPMPPVQPAQAAPQPALPVTAGLNDASKKPGDVGAPASTEPTELTIQKIENVDLDQMVNAVPATPVAAPEVALAAQSTAPTNSYFPSTPQADIVLVNNTKRPINKQLIVRIGIIVAVVVVLAVGGYFVATKLMSTKKTQPTPTATTTTQTPTIAQPSFTSPATTTSTTPTDTTTAAATTTSTPPANTSSAPATTTVTTPAAPTPAPTPAPATPTSPAVANTGLDW